MVIRIMKSNMMTRIILITMIICLIESLISYYIYLRLRTYEENYSERLGFTEPIFYLGYNGMVDKFGKPQKTEQCDGYFKAHYDDFVFMFWGLYEPWDFMNVLVKSDKYKFGRNKICVGSTKEEVLWAYRHVPRSPDEGYHFVDGKYFIMFSFDEDDCVDGIMILKNPPT